MLTIQERWRFESISNQLASYSPHKPHSLIKWATDHRVTLSRTNSRVRQAPPVPEDCSGDRGIQGIPRLRTAPLLFSSTITNTAHGGSTPGPDSVKASRLERLILPAKCGACVPHDKRAVNDRSLINTGRGTMINPPQDPARSQIPYHTWLFFPIAFTANQTGVHLYLAGDRESTDFYQTKQTKHRLCVYLHRTR